VRRDEAEVGGKNRAGRRGCRGIKETRTSTRKVVILFDGMGGAWRPAVLVEDLGRGSCCVHHDVEDGPCQWMLGMGKLGERRPALRGASH